ncbi:hypothetical protein ES703_20200 [subsurface metagenome]
MNNELRTLTTLFGYGEDALTLWAITERLDLILEELGDDSDPEYVFYRPSFGRGHYGEFDAIIITSKKAYLVESKWDGSGDLSRLEEHQIRRHKILKWFHDNWKGEVGEDWDGFARKNNLSFSEEFSRDIPSSNTILSQNIQAVLNLMIGKEIENVLLYLHRGKPTGIDTDFKIVELEYETIYGNFIELLSKRG